MERIRKFYYHQYVHEGTQGRACSQVLKWATKRIGQGNSTENECSLQQTTERRGWTDWKIDFPAEKMRLGANGGMEKASREGFEGLE